MKKYFLFILVLNLFLSCKTDTKLAKYAITKCIEVDRNYQYSKDMVWFKGKKYRPIITSEYNNDTLKSVVIYKPEGKIFYNKLEVKEDPLLMEMYEIVEIKKSKLKGSAFCEDNKVHQITEQTKDSIFCLSRNDLLLIKIIE